MDKLGWKIIQYLMGLLHFILLLFFNERVPIEKGVPYEFWVVCASGVATGGGGRSPPWLNPGTEKVYIFLCGY